MTLGSPLHPHRKLKLIQASQTVARVLGTVDLTDQFQVATAGTHMFALRTSRYIWHLAKSMEKH